MTETPATAAETLTITHCRESGTLIEGTAKGDGSNTVLKASGWRWSRNLGTWYVPHSRDRAARDHLINTTAEQLRAAGFTVETDIDDTARPAAEVEQDKAQRARDRAEALANKANRRAAAADQAQDSARAAAARLPEGGEPIKIGHHSENRHRNAIDKANRATRRAIDADKDAQEAAERADTAAQATARRHNPVTVANRIQALQADKRRAERRLNGHTRTLFTQGESRYVESHEPAQGSTAERLREYITELTDQITHWEGIRAEQIAAGEATNYSRETIRKGDQVKFRGTWYEVRRVNPKSVTIPSMIGGSWTDTVVYHELSGHRPAA